MRRFASVPVLVLLVFAPLAVFSVVWAPHLLTTKGLTTAKDRAEDAGRIRTACLAVLAGGLAPDQQQRGGAASLGLPRAAMPPWRVEAMLSR